MQDKLVWPTSYINKIICGDCLEVMKEIPDKAVDLVMGELYAQLPKLLN